MCSSLAYSEQARYELAEKARTLLLSVEFFCRLAGAYNRFQLLPRRQQVVNVMVYEATNECGTALYKKRGRLGNQ